MGKELSISKIYVSILDSTFSSRTTSKILEESESKKFDPKPAIKILNENVRSNRDRNRRRYQKKESKRQQNNLHFWNKILKKTQQSKIFVRHVSILASPWSKLRYIRKITQKYKKTFHAPNL